MGEPIAQTTITRAGALKRLSILINHEVGVDIGPLALQRLIANHWPKLSLYAHIIHKENERED